MKKGREQRTKKLNLYGTGRGESKRGGVDGVFWRRGPQTEKVTKLPRGGMTSGNAGGETFPVPIREEGGGGGPKVKNSPP